MKNISLSLLCLVLSAPLALLQAQDLTNAPAASSQPLSSGPSFTDAEKETQRQAALTILAQLQTAIDQNAKNFVVPPGNYRFEGESGRHFQLKNVTGMSIEAAGATFYFNTNFGVRLNHCRDVTIHGLTADTDPLPWVQGRIIALDRQTPTIDLELEPGYRPPEQVKYRMVFFEGKTGRELPVFDTGTAGFQDLGKNQIRLTKFSRDWFLRGVDDANPVSVGDRVALLDERFAGGNVVVENCENVTLDGLTLYGAAGFAYNESEGVGGNHYKNCKLVLRPNSNRLMASKADCFHSLVVQKGPDIEHCEFSHSGDDLLAVHGFFSVITAKTGPRQLTVASASGVPFAVGSRVDFLRLPNGDKLGEATATAMTEITDPAQRAATKDLPDEIRKQLHLRIRPMNGSSLFQVTFDQDVPADKFDLIESPDFCGAGAVIRGNYLHDGNIRGILVKSHDVTIENNTIERVACGGIVLEAESFWLEGPYEKNIRVAGNHVKECGFNSLDPSGLSLPVAGIHVGDGFGAKQFPRTFLPNLANENITIENNDVASPAGFGIFVSNTTGVKIDNNRIDAPFASGDHLSFYDFSKLPLKGWTLTPDLVEALKQPCFATYIFASSDIEITNNQVTNPPAFLKGNIGYGPGATAPAQASSP
jgi:hypothetical protein